MALSLRHTPTCGENILCLHAPIGSKWAYFRYQPKSPSARRPRTPCEGAWAEADCAAVEGGADAPILLRQSDSPARTTACRGESVALLPVCGASADTGVSTICIGRPTSGVPVVRPVPARAGAGVVGACFGVAPRSGASTPPSRLAWCIASSSQRTPTKHAPATSSPLRRTACSA